MGKTIYREIKQADMKQIGELMQTRDELDFEGAKKRT